MKWYLLCILILFCGCNAQNIQAISKRNIKKLNEKRPPRPVGLRRRVPREEDFNGETGITADLMVAESDQWNVAWKKARSAGFELGVFYHTSSWAPHWREVIDEQLRIVSGHRQFGNKASTLDLPWSDDIYPSVLKDADYFLLNAVANKYSQHVEIRDFVDSLQLKYREKIKIEFNKTVTRGTFLDSTAERKSELLLQKDLSEGEVSTINKLQDYCQSIVQSGKRAMVLYFHNKGGCCSRKRGEKQEAAVSSWRELMNTFVLMFPSICVRSILYGYSACGVEPQMAHFSGNFWWADCHHVNSLPRLHDRFDALAVEYFIMNVSMYWERNELFGMNCAYGMYKSPKIDHYEEESPYPLYKERLHKFAYNFNLIPNPTATILGSSNRKWLEEHCINMKFSPYRKQKGWAADAYFPLNSEDSP